MRQHRMLLAATASVVLAVGVMPAASADDPAADKAKVEQQLVEVKSDLQESTAAVATATASLQEVDGRLAAAQSALAAAQAQLDAARAEDERLAGELAAAQSEEDAAETALVEIQTSIDADRDTLTGLARSAYQGGQLSQISAILSSDSFTDYTQRSEGMRSVLRTQAAIIDTLADHRAQQATTQATLEAVRERVAVARTAAATNLAAKEGLEAEAAAATAEVQRLHDERAAVLASAQSTLAADEAEYQALQAEGDRLETLLAQRAAEQSAAAAAPSQPPASGESSGVLYRPVSGWVTSPYGWRVHPISGLRKFHDGTDFGAGCGTPIRAAASGTVLSTHYAGGYGNQTVIEHGSIGGQYLATSYNHQSAFAVSAGQHVDRGQVIGYVGTTGYSTGCHLHFIVYANGSTTDPMNYL